MTRFEKLLLIFILIYICMLFSNLMALRELRHSNQDLIKVIEEQENQPYKVEVKYIK